MVLSLLVAFPLVMLAADVASPTPEQAGFRLVVLQETWDALGLGYKHEPALSRLREVAVADALFTLAGPDIDSYEWETQTIRLTAAASERMVAALLGARKRADGVEALQALTKDLGWGNPAERALYTRAFVVLVGEERIYGGIFLDEVSQMAVDFPVARCRIEAGRVVFNLLPVHLPFFGADPGAGEPATKQAELTREHGAVNEVPDRMIEYFRKQAATPHACAMRALIKDARIRDALARLGLLREPPPAP